MPTNLIEDDSGVQTTESPANQVAKYLKDNWTITDPAVTDIDWQTNWLSTAFVTIAFEEITRPAPMTVGWHKWQYRCFVQIKITTRYDIGGNYPVVIKKIRKRIEDMMHISVTDMKTYGFSVKRITAITDKANYPATTAYKDDICELTIEVELLQSKTVVTT